MSKINDLLPAMKWFEGIQIEQLALPKNVAKSDYREVSEESYHAGILSNVHDLRKEGNPKVAIERCADIANLAMLLAAKIANDAMIAEL